MVFAVHSCLMDQEMSVSLKYRDLKPSWFFNSFLVGGLGEFVHFTFSCVLYNSVLTVRLLLCFIWTANSIMW